jgi:hypothetical protein
MKKSSMTDHTTKLTKIIFTLAMIPLTSVGLGYLIAHTIFG